MIEEHFNSDTLMAMVICGFVLILALILVTACLVWPWIDLKYKIRKEDHDDFRGVTREEHRKYITHLINATKYKG